MNNSEEIWIIHGPRSPQRRGRGPWRLCEHPRRGYNEGFGV